MKKNIVKLLSVVSILAVLLTACSGGAGKIEDISQYPSKEIEIIVPAGAGGGTDAAARALANEMKEDLGVGIGILNKPGASGSVGMTEGANAKADGYTLSMVFVELTMFEHLGLSPLRPSDVKPVALVNLDPAALTVRADAPYDTLEEFVEYAKANPGEISVGNAGTGSIWHIAAEILANDTGIELNHIPHEGAAPAVTALVGGHVDAVTVSPAEVRAQIEAGNLKTLAIMSDERSEVMPEVPTFKEEGYDIQEVATWRGITVPNDTPDEIVEKLEKSVMEAANTDSFKEFMASNGLGISVKNSVEFGQYMEENQKMFGEIIKELNLGN